MSAPRVAVIAAGAHIFGAAHVPALEALEADVVGLYDVHRSSAEAVGKPRSWAVVDTLEELLELDADIAVVASPHPLHRQHAEQALDAGMHVLVEKPLGATPSDGRRIVAAAARSGRVAAVALQHRFRAEVVAARHMVEASAIGTIHRVAVVASYPKRGAYYDAAPWRGTWDGEGGGALLNQGQHDLDTLVHIVGPPQRVVGWARTRVQPIETEDTVEAMLEWPGGALGSVHVTTAASDAPTRIEIVGSSGTLRLTPGALDVAQHPEDFLDFARSEGGPFDPFALGERREQPGGGGTHTDIYADLFAALADDRAPRTAAADALPALDLSAAIVLSSSLDRPVSLPLDVAAYDALVDRHLTEGSLTRAAATKRAGAPL